MDFNIGDRVHVTRLDWEDVDFYATLSGFDSYYKTVELTNSTNRTFECKNVFLPNDGYFGPYDPDYYVLATDEESSKERTLNNLDANAYETKLIIEDEEDTEAPEVQHIKRENKIELDGYYIIEVKKGLYVQNATSNYFFKFTKDINKADVYEYENAALKHAEFVDGRVRNLKRYLEE